MHDVAQNLCHSIRRSELLRPGDRVGVAVSGGQDSVAMLRLLLELRNELGVVLSVVHINHKLRGGESDGDADFISKLAREHKLQLHCTIADVVQHASQHRISIETAARELRYQFFRELLGATRPRFPRICTDGKADSSDPWKSVEIPGPVLNKIATGHTLDDQAETVLMRIIRGTGPRGMRGIQPRIHVETERGSGEIVRPLLQVRRGELQAYLKDIGQSWREDASNRDPKFTRNRVRHVLMPILERDFNPAISERLAELAAIARGEEEFWDNEVAGWMGTGIHWVEPQSGSAQLVRIAAVTNSSMLGKDDRPAPMNVLVDLAWLLSEEIAVQRRILRAVADRAGLSLDFQHVEEILRLAAEEVGTGKEVILPAGWKVLCDEDAVEFIAPKPDTERGSENYELALRVPGEVAIAQIGSRFQAIRLNPSELPADSDPEQLFDPGLLGDTLTVRNWRAGDRFWPAHRKAPKKIKELLQESHVPQPERSQWPVVLSGNEVIWVRGLPGRAQMRPAEGSVAVLIREQPLKGHS